MTTLYDPSDSEIATLDFTSILVNSGLNSLKIKSTKSKNESNKIGQKWFDDECYNFRTKAIKKLQNRSADQTKRISSEGKKYKRMLKEKKKMYKQKLIKEMAVLKHNNSKLYWEILAKLKECDQITQHTNLTESVPPDEWQRHFKTLTLNDNVDTDLDWKLDELEKDKFAHNKTSLDFPFNMKEIKQAIKSSKSGKSPSDDLLLNGEA